MTKHQTISGLVVVAVLAAATTAAATMRSHLASTDRPVAPAGMVLFNTFAADVNKLPTEDFEDQSLVFSTSTKH
jgi:hypothetical protein